MRSDLLSEDLPKDGQKWLKSVSDTAKKEKAKFVTLVAVVRD
jgi:hypothetical protein